jgi:general secretion pathway protein D
MGAAPGSNAAGVQAATAIAMSSASARPAAKVGSAAASTAQPAPQDRTEIIRGSGVFIARLDDKSVATRKGEKGEFTLKFEGAEMREIARVVLGDILKVNYVIDSNLASTPVYMQTATPLSRRDLLPTLETLLGNYGAVIVFKDGVYNIVPQSSGLTSVLAPRTRVLQDQGYQNIVVPLRYISATEMQKILSSIHKAKSGVSIDAHRNLLMLRGTRRELLDYLKTVEIFDIDQMAGMSIGLFPLESVDVMAVKHELELILDALAGEGGKQLVKLIEIERINSLLAITPQPKYLQDIRQWIKRLDRAELSAGHSMYVYFVQNGDAKKLADVLQQLMGGMQKGTGKSANGSKRGNENAGEMPGQAQAAQDQGKKQQKTTTQLTSLMSKMNLQTAVLPSVNGLDDVGFIADEDRNALIIMATPEQYKQIERVINKLDVSPNQVLVEASIIEVSLTDEFSFGLEWYFRNSSGGKTGTAQLDLGAAGVAAIVPGFSYSIVDRADRIAVALNALASDTKVRVISSPSLMVLDNKTATITVGDQVPIRTSETVSQSTSGNSPVITSTIQFRDTGVSLEVTPRVNNSGKVIMDIHQEVSSVDRTTTSSIDSPTINKREIKTSVAVPSGDTIVLGGLIQDDNQNSNSGLPGLKDMPLFSWLFGKESKSSSRTELLVLITPTAILDDSDAREATAELKRKMKGLMQHNEPY